jgi:hypothetical protein
VGLSHIPPPWDALDRLEHPRLVMKMSRFSEFRGGARRRAKIRPLTRDPCKPYVTTPIAGVLSVRHIHHILASIHPGSVLARWMVGVGAEVVPLCVCGGLSTQHAQPRTGGGGAQGAGAAPVCSRPKRARTETGTALAMCDVRVRSACFGYIVYWPGWPGRRCGGGGQCLFNGFFGA